MKVLSPLVMILALALAGCEDDPPPPATAPPPPPPADQNNVCTRDICAYDANRAQQCSDFLQACLLANPANEDECIGGAALICQEGEGL